MSDVPVSDFLTRGREFTMKDAYSFDRDVEGLRGDQIMFDAYVNIFNRFGLKFRPVAADNGAIGENRFR